MTRRTATVLLLAAIGVLAALALADALRPGSHSRPAAVPSTTTKPKPPTLLDTLRRETVTGFVLYSDRDCRLHSLLLPRMVDDVIRDEGGSDVFRCRFDVEGGRIVSERSGRAANGLVVQGGNIASSGRVVLTHGDLLRAAYKHPNLADYSRTIPLRLRITGLARLGEQPVVALEAFPRFLEPQFLAAVFDGKDVSAVAVSFRGPYEHLFVSADGALVGSADGTVFTRTGRSIDPPQNLPQGRAVAFTPDDRWLVWLTGNSIYLVGGPQEDGRIIRLPIAARDLVWEPVSSGTSFGPPIRR